MEVEEGRVGERRKVLGIRQKCIVIYLLESFPHQKSRPFVKFIARNT